MDKDGGGVCDKGGGDSGTEIVLSYWEVLLDLRFSEGGGTAPFLSELCFHDEEEEDLAEPADCWCCCS